MVARKLHRSAALFAIALATTFMLLVIAACATGSTPALHPGPADRSVPVDITGGDAGESSPTTLWLVRDAILDAGLSELRIPSWPEYRDAVESFYTRRDFTAAWIRKSRPSQAALEVIDLLEHADEVGLTAEDYDAGRWVDRVDLIRSKDAAELDRARFDLALTVSAMRYASDLHRGRIDPRALRFVFDSADSRAETFDPTMVLEELASTSKVEAVFDSVAPQDPQYRGLLDALGRYRELARTQGDAPPRFVTDEVIRPGDTYADLPRLAELLTRLGDLRTFSAIDLDTGPSELTSTTLYDGEIVEAVARFQRRHGLEPDGKIGKETQRQLATPLESRVRQIELAIERLRWQSRSSVEPARPAIVVNIPEFRLRALDRNGEVAFTTNVVVGRAKRTETPVFTELMRTVVFRPSWYVPSSITSREIVPEMEKDPSHLESEGYEILGGDGNDASSEAVLTDLRSGALRLRQKPGPQNALGPVKFLFPNEWNVYLHGTPSTKGFARPRRDLSHGCMRVADPIGLAEWVLQDQPDWDRERISEAVAGPKNEVAVTLDTPIPVRIEYHTVVTAEDGEVFFLNDLYGHDPRLERALERRHLDDGKRAAQLGSN